MSSNAKIKIVYRKASSLKPYGANARIHSDQQVQQIAESIKAFGWTNPILIDKDLTVLAGHGRLAAAQLLGMDRVPTILVSHLSEADKKAYILADNKLAENAGWDKDLVRLEVGAIAKLDANFSFDVTGFSAPAIDAMLSPPANDSGNDEQDFKRVDDGALTVARRGDIWILGSHRLVCGDATEAAAYARALDGQQASMVFTDPPYNVPIDEFVTGGGRKKQKRFAMASGEMTQDAFTAFLESVMLNMCAVSKDGALHYICMDWRHAFETLSAARPNYSEQKNLCVWNKANAGMGSFYRSKHELVFVFKKGTAKSINNIELGKHGRHRANVWDYPGGNGFHVSRKADLASHPTVKPTALIADAMLDASRKGDIILDPFCGSGATILAAEQTGRKAAAIEIEPAYVDLAIERFEAATGTKAMLYGSRLSFEAARAERTQWLAAVTGERS